MRCYLVKCPTAARYAATNADAREAKASLLKKGVDKKAIFITQEDIPVAKAELLKFINKLMEKQDIKTT